MTPRGPSPDARENEARERLALEGEVLTAEEVARREGRVRSEFWGKLRRVARRIPFARDLLASYHCATDPETPLRVKATLLGALAYFIMPVDAMPDMLVGLGFTDDAAVLAIAIKMVATHILPRHREAAERSLAEDLPNSPRDVTPEAAAAGPSGSAS